MLVKEHLQRNGHHPKKPAIAKKARIRHCRAKKKPAYTKMTAKEMLSDLCGVSRQRVPEHMKHRLTIH